MSFPGGWEWLVVLAIVALIFGTKKLRSIGSDVGGAVKNFKAAMTEAESIKEEPPEPPAELDKPADTSEDASFDSSATHAEHSEPKQ